jgi:methionyl-tRNA formyltransferase
LRIAFAGTPEFALPALHALADSGHELVGVLTQPDRPRGRGRLVTPSPVKRAALARGLPISQPATLATAADRSALDAWWPDVLVVVAYGLILPASILELPRLGCLNIHASLLPRWRGAAPIQRAILAGDTETGVSIMRMDAGLDTGPVLIERRVPIERTATSGTLHDRLAALGAEALLDALRGIEAGTIRPRPQSAEGVTYAAKITKAEARIDWRASALAIERQIRAFNPWPIAETRVAGEPLRILAAQAGDGAPRETAAHGETQVPRAIDMSPTAAVRGPAASAELPGTIVAVERGAILVRCGQGTLAVTELQRPGRNPQPADAFVNAVRLAPGQRLE